MIIHWFLLAHCHFGQIEARLLCLYFTSDWRRWLQGYGASTSKMTPLWQEQAIVQWFKEKKERLLQKLASACALIIKSAAWGPLREFVFCVQIQPTVYKVKLCFINPPDEKLSCAFYPSQICRSSGQPPHASSQAKAYKRTFFSTNNI